MTHEAAHAATLLDGFLELVTPEGFRAELIEEEIVVSPPPRRHPYVIPDGVFAPRERRLFLGADSWMPPEGVAMVAEVTSSKPDRDRVVKRHCYAKGEIPLYLLVDRAQRSITLFSSPDPAEGVQDYLEDNRVPFGKPLTLPAPFEFDLDTSDLQ